MSVTGMSVKNIDIVLANDFAKLTHAEYISFRAHRHREFFYGRSPMVIGQNRAVWLAGNGYLMAALRKFLNEPTRLLLSAAPSGLLVDMEYLHNGRADPDGSIAFG
jgi:hypothetical protein